MSRVRRRLRERLRDEGFEVSLNDFRPALGGERTSVLSDIYRWTAPAVDAKGHRCRLYSWSTMTDCARYGVEVYHEEGDSVWEWNVLDKKGSKPP